jgi:hypothetical protein
MSVLLLAIKARISTYRAQGTSAAVGLFSLADITPPMLLRAQDLGAERLEAGAVLNGTALASALKVVALDAVQGPVPASCMLSNFSRLGNQTVSAAKESQVPVSSCLHWPSRVGLQLTPSSQAMCTARDASGNTGALNITVLLIDTKAPRLTLIGLNPTYIFTNQPYNRDNVSVSMFVWLFACSIVFFLSLHLSYSLTHSGTHTNKHTQTNKHTHTHTHTNTHTHTYTHRHAQAGTRTHARCLSLISSLSMSSQRRRTPVAPRSTLLLAILTAL